MVIYKFIPDKLNQLSSGGSGDKKILCFDDGQGMNSLHPLFVV
jgi:hypothetical protein